MKKVLYLFLCFFTSLMLQAQCGILDALCYDNDDSAGDFLITLCPDIPSETIEININSFELYSGDQLNIYEGNDINGNLIASFEGEAGVVLFEDELFTASTIGNCLTLDFVSNSNVSCVDGTTVLGTFIEVLPLNFSTSCSCPRPIASFTMDETELCSNANTTVNFTGNGIGQNGAAIVEYAWDFYGDGEVDETSTSPNASYTYPVNVGSGYSPALFVTDENGCQSVGVFDLVLVSAAPENWYISTPLNAVCAGEDFTLTSFVEGGGFIWTPDISIEQEVQNEDEFNCQSLFVDNPFADNEISCATDIEVSINIEHNWVGDIGIWLICPDGTVLTLHESNAGDIDTDPFLECEPATVVSETTQADILAEPQNLQGEYIFVSPIDVINLETLQEELEDNSGLNTIITPGEYLSSQSLANLNGCPINGEWQLIVQDFWPCGPFGAPPCASPDAFPITIESWSITFGNCDFSVSVGQSGVDYLLDGESVGTVNQASTTITAPEQEGIYDYTTVYTDVFGCEYSYSETISIEVLSTEDELCGGNVPVIAQLDLNVFFEGAYNATTGEMNTDLEAYIPGAQPYNVAPYFYEGTETIIPFLGGIVDWVLVEIREGTPSLTEQSTTVLARKAGLLTANGEIIDAETGSSLEVENLFVGTPYYICIRHRNHLDILSAIPVEMPDSGNKVLSYDFTSSAEAAFGLEQIKDLSNGTFGMFAADFVGEGIIQTTDFDEWFSSPAIVGVYGPTDANLDGIVQTTDYDLWFANKAKVGTPEIRF